MLCSLRQGLVSPLLPLSNQHSVQCEFVEGAGAHFPALQFTMCGVYCATVMWSIDGGGGDTSACDKPVSLSRGGVLPNDLPRDNDGRDDHQDFDDIGNNDENILYICSLNQLWKIKNRKLRWWGPTDPKKLDMLCNLLWTLNCCFCCCCCCWAVPCAAEGAGEWSDVGVINDV